MAAVLLAVLPLLIGASPAAAATRVPGRARCRPRLRPSRRPRPAPSPPRPCPGRCRRSAGPRWAPAATSSGPATPPLPAEVTAAGFVLADLDTGAVLAARAPHARQRPASTLKVLTAMVAIDRLDPDAQVAGAPEDLSIDGSRAGIGPGGTYTVRQLLTGLLLNSGNDTAQALARAMGGDAATVGRDDREGPAARRPRHAARRHRPGSTGRAWRRRPTTWRCCSATRWASRCSPRRSRRARSRSPGYGDRPGFVLSNANPLLVPLPRDAGQQDRLHRRRAAHDRRRRASATGGGWWCRWCAPRTRRS